MAGYAIPIEKEMACANATEKISTIAAEVISRKINGMKLKEAKGFLGKLLGEKVSVSHRFYANAAERMLALLNSAENNAIAKGLDTETLMVMVSASKGPKIFRARRKRAFGMRMKSAHLQIVLKHAPAKKVAEFGAKPEEEKAK